MQVGQIYKSNDPAFGWIFVITKVFPSGDFFAKSDAGVTYWFNRGRESGWTLLDGNAARTAFALAESGTSDWYSAWRDDR